ncbi:MAG: hypothetical protein ABL999_18950 [Pyrinomonadaceae bacterium]
MHFVETTAFRKRLDKLADLNTLFAIQAIFSKTRNAVTSSKDAVGLEKAV